MSRRSQRVEDLIRLELSSLILRKMGDPRVRLASVTGVDVSPDLTQARVTLSILGSEEDRESCLEALRNASGFLRNQLARSLRHMKRIPELRFEMDHGAEYSQQISSILEHLEIRDEPS